jgi:hypothetical protein
MCVRPTDELTNGTPAANIAHLAFSLSNATSQLATKT